MDSPTVPVSSMDVPTVPVSSMTVPVSAMTIAPESQVSSMKVPVSSMDVPTVPVSAMTIAPKSQVSAMTLEIILSIIMDQNKQLLKIIADDYDIYYPDLLIHIPDRYEIVKYLGSPRELTSPSG